MRQSDWVDGQLYRCLPVSAELDALGDTRLSVPQSAWPEGFDEVVFDSAASDEQAARDLIEAYLRCIEDLAMPRLIDFDVTLKDEDAHLFSAFRGLIHGWRAAVIERMTKFPRTA